MKAYRQELIGAQVTITKANNQELVGLKGIVIDETKHTLVVKTTAGTKRVIKAGVVFMFVIDGTEHIIDGDTINVSPEERVKLK